MKSNFRSESFERKIQLNSFCRQFDDWMIQKIEKMISKGLSNKGVKKPRLKLNPKLVLICLQSTVPRRVKGEPASRQGHLTSPLDTYSVNIYKHNYIKSDILFLHYL